VTGPVYQTLPLYSTLKTTGTYIYATDFDIKKKEATINAESEIKNESSNPQKVEFEVVVADLDGNETARFTGSEVTVQPNATAVVSASSNMKDLHFWSWGYGYLYDVYTSLIRYNYV